MRSCRNSSAPPATCVLSARTFWRASTESTRPPRRGGAASGAEVEEVFRLPASAFWPQPEVASCFVRFLPHSPDPKAKDYSVFSDVVGKLFQHRRKTLRRAMELAWGRDIALHLLSKTQIDAKLRPDKVAPAEFVRLADVLDGVMG